MSREALARKFSYEAPVNYRIGESPAAYIIYMLHMKTALKSDLDDLKVEVRTLRYPL